MTPGQELRKMSINGMTPDDARSKAERDRKKLLDPDLSKKEKQEIADLRERLRRMEAVQDQAYVQKTERAMLLDAVSGEFSGDREHVLGARAATDSATTGALAIHNLLDGSLSGVPADIGSMATALREQAAEIPKGDNSAIKELLATQMVLSDLLAKECIRKAASTEEILSRAGVARPLPEAIVGYHGRILELALKAMGQTERTAKAIIALDAGSRSHTFVKAQQANLTNQQVVQNNQPVEVLASEADNPDHDIQLLENKANANWCDAGVVDTREKVEAIPGDSELEAVGAQHRPGDRKRKT